MIEASEIPQETENLEPAEEGKKKIVFSPEIENLSRIVFDSDDLPGVDDYQSKKLVEAYLRSFNAAVEKAQGEMRLAVVLKNIHKVALGGVNWKRTIAFLESSGFAEKYDYQSGNFRLGLPTRLSFANAFSGVEYDCPDAKTSAEMVDTVDDFVSRNTEKIDRCDERYFSLASASALLIFLSHPFPGGNKRVIRPMINHILTKGGLVGRWLEGDSDFREKFKSAWTGLVESFQRNTGLERAEDDPEYDRKWFEYWKDKLDTDQIFKSNEVKDLADIIKKAPYYTHSLMQKAVVK